eukprot:11218688-Lingulodinium_polyedra.AAC.1
MPPAAREDAVRQVLAQRLAGLLLVTPGAPLERLHLQAEVRSKPRDEQTSQQLLEHHVQTCAD